MIIFNFLKLNKKFATLYEQHKFREKTRWFRVDGCSYIFYDKQCNYFYYINDKNQTKTFMKIKNELCFEKIKNDII